MNRLRSTLSVMAVAGTSLGAVWSGPAQEPGGAPPKGVAVVELFTSEGCSSCPSADRVASDLAAHAPPGVFVLAMHVDYWDSLGWKDRLASAEFTRRQRRHAESLGLTNVYTPQMIVNGRAEFVGSNKERAMRAIDDARLTPARVEIAADAVRDAGGVRVTVTTKDAPRGAILNAALVQNGLESSVRRGENAGRTLRHDRVVRALDSRPADRSGAIVLRIPADAAEAKLEVVVWIEDAATMRVLGAASPELRS